MALTGFKNVGDTVMWFWTPKQKAGFRDLEIYPIKQYDTATVVGVEMGFTSYGPQEDVPYYDVQLKDGTVVERVNPYFFQASKWDLPRDYLDVARDRVEKALKGIKVKKERSFLTRAHRILRTVAPSSPELLSAVANKLKAAPGIKLVSDGPPEYLFSIPVRYGENKYNDFNIKVLSMGMSVDVHIQSAPFPRIGGYEALEPSAKRVVARWSRISNLR